MKTWVKAKLASVRGDTLVEALVALLIAAMGAALLATMVMVSTNVAITSRQSLDALYKAESVIEENPDEYAKVTITLGNTTISPKVTLYQSENDSPFVRYENKNLRPEDFGL